METTLRETCGRQFASRFNTAARAASLRLVRATEHLGARRGPLSARATFADRPVKPDNAPDIRKQAFALLLVLGWMRPGGRRTGHPTQGHALNMKAIAGRTGVSVRELERYLVVWADAGLLKRWQPPASSNAPKGNLSGHCFNLFELVDEMPDELRAELERWHGTSRRATRQALTTAPTARAALPDVTDGADVLAYLRARPPPY